MRRIRRGFTLMEVLATLLLLGIVLPVAMRGLSVGMNVADSARHNAEAASLAQAKLNELVSTDQWSSSTAGDFGQGFPGYRWMCESSAKDFNVYEVVLTVTWESRGSERRVNVATLVY